MIKKIAVLLLTVALLIAFVPTAAAQQPVVTVSFSQQEITVGDTFTVTIDAVGTGITKLTAQLDTNSYIEYRTGNMGFDTDTMRYTISFNPSKAPLVIECVAMRKGTASMILRDIKCTDESGTVSVSDTGADVKIIPVYTPVYTKQDLHNIRNNLSGDYILMNDIVFTEEDFAEGGEFYMGGFGWCPIGAIVNNSFKGSFNGNGYAVYGLQMNRAYYDFGGLFGVSQGEIENLRLIEAKIDGEYGINTSVTVGSGTLQGDVDYNDKDVWTDPDGNITVDSLDKYDRNGISTATVGMICGYNLGSIMDCYVSGSVKGNTYVGAVAGRSTGTISGCAVNARVESKLTAGGICGVTGVSATVSDCVSQGSVSASVVGGIIGSAKGNVTRVYTTSQINGGTANKDFGEGYPTYSQVYAVTEEEAAEVVFDGGNWDYDRIIPYPKALGDLLPFREVISDKGDVDNDGDTDATDLAKLKLYLSGNVDESINGDINGDSEVSSLDLGILKLILSGT